MKAHPEQKTVAVEAPCLQAVMEGVSHDCVLQNLVGLRRVHDCHRARMVGAEVERSCWVLRSCWQQTVWMCLAERVVDFVAVLEVRSDLHYYDRSCLVQNDPEHEVLQA